MQRVLVKEFGAPSVMALESGVAAPILGAKDVAIKVSYAGINFIDTYFRTGLYKKPSMPYTPGEEGSGVVEAVGPEADAGLLGKRVAFFRCNTGSYANVATTAATDVFPIPDGVSDDVAAAVMLQGCTAHYLVHDCYAVKSGDTVLVHAAAGGTGLLISQMCKLKGATVIGTCSKDKSSVARETGKVDHIIDYRDPEWVAEVRKICPQGVAAVFDGVGKATFEKGLECLRKRGAMISFGNASGAVEPIAPLTLTKYGSLSLQRPKLGDYSDPGEIDQRVSDIMQWLNEGKLTVLVGKTFALADAVKAHEYLEGRASIGKIVLDCRSQ